MSEFYLEGATAVDANASQGLWSFVIVGNGQAAPAKRRASWSRLREKPFASRDEAWHWLHANGEKIMRYRVLAVRLLEVVEQRVPQLIAMFHEATPEQVASALPQPDKASTALAHGDLPGDEWKRGSTEDDDA